MTVPDPVPQEIYDNTRLVSSCSRHQASSFGNPAFAGLMNSWDSQATQKQELLIAYVSGLATLLVDKGIFTQEEFADSVKAWLTGRLAWAEDIANQVIAAWNAENPSQAQPELDVSSASFAHIEPPAQFPFWPWMFAPTPEPIPE